MPRPPSSSDPPTRIRVPATSANLGPGFDVLGLALDLHLDVVLGDRSLDSDDPHRNPALKGFRRAGGVGPLGWTGAIPPGRGLGFSGAARVGGIIAAILQQGGSLAESHHEVLAIGTELEGHPDNVAASLYGGVVAAAGGHAVRIPLASIISGAAVVLWVPPEETSTDQSRTGLPSTIAFEDAVFNVGRSSLLCAALAAGDVEALRVATEDRFHQDQRLALHPRSYEALRAALAAGAWCAWLSGSGPAIAALVDPAPDTVDRVTRALAALGGVAEVVVTRIAPQGAHVLSPHS